MTRSSLLSIPVLLAAGVMLTASGGGRVANAPATIAYVCEDGRQASAIYEHGGDYRHAKMLLSYDGRTTELEAAPTLYGIRYLAEPSAAEPRALMWSLRGERAVLAEAVHPDDVADGGRPIATCQRLRIAQASGVEGAGHSADDH